MLLHLSHLLRATTGAARRPPHPLADALARQREGTSVSTERRRVGLALLLSLLLHALLLSLTFGGQELGLPGLGFPWRERRGEAPDLRVVLVPAPGTAAQPAQPAHTSINHPLRPRSIERHGEGGPPPTPSVPQEPTPATRAVDSEPKGEAIATATATPKPDALADATAAKLPLASEGSGRMATPPIAAPGAAALQQPAEAKVVVSAGPSTPMPVIAAAPIASSPKSAIPAAPDGGDVAQERIEAQARERAAELAQLDLVAQEARRQAAALREAARKDAARQEAQRTETARLEAERQEAERIETARLEAEQQATLRQAAAQQAAARQDAARQEAQRIETARLEAERQEAERIETARLDAEQQATLRQAAAQQAAARQDASRQEAQRIETARLEAERQETLRQEAAMQDAARRDAARRDAERIETARLEAERQEVARQATAQQEAARQPAARQEAARSDAAQEEEARRESRLRAIGRQLDEEAARREAAASAANSASRLAPSSSGARRGRLFGRADANAELVRYAEAWARKIELNMTFDMVREAAKRPHTNPLVTVAIRSDGSVESVSFVRSSGVADIDEAIRRIVESQLPYPAFPPALAREFDVVEIRRSWHFDMAVRLY